MDPETKQARFEREALVHLDTLHRVALRLTDAEPDAEDLVQESLLKAYRAWDTYEAGTNARGWLLTILRHTFINEYRRRKRRGPTVDIDAIEAHTVFAHVQETDPEGKFFDRIVDATVREAIERLPDEFREPLILSDVEQMKYQEVADVLGIPVGTVKSRLFRARQRLQRDLYDYAVEMGYFRPSQVE